MAPMLLKSLMLLYSIAVYISIAFPIPQVSQVDGHNAISSCSSLEGFNLKLLGACIAPIFRNNPEDPRLTTIYGQRTNSSTPLSIVTLTYKATISICKGAWTAYSPGSILSRWLIWKAALLAMVASSPLPPFGPRIQGFALLGMLGDPIGSLKSLLIKLELSLECSKYWQQQLFVNQDLRIIAVFIGRNGYDDVEHLWRALTLIELAYMEWGKQCSAQVRSAMSGIFSHMVADLQGHENPSISDRDAILRLVHDLQCTASHLAANVSTRIIPLTVTMVWFIFGLRTSCFRILGSQSLPDIEAFSLAFSALWFWTIPVTSLMSMIGTPSTGWSTPAILNEFKRKCQRIHDHGTMLPIVKEPGELLGGPKSKHAKEEQASRGTEEFNVATDTPGHSISYSAGVKCTRHGEAEVFGDEARLVGGISNWVGHVLLQHQGWFLVLLLNGLPVFLVSVCCLCSTSITWIVPPFGIKNRCWAQIAIYSTWVMAYLLNFPPRSFRLTLFENAISALGTSILLICVQIGIFNRANSYTNGHNGPEFIPTVPAIRTILVWQAENVYWVLALSLYLTEVLFIPFVLRRYISVIRVFAQRDDKRYCCGILHAPWRSIDQRCPICYRWLHRFMRKVVPRHWKPAHHTADHEPDQDFRQSPEAVQESNGRGHQSNQIPALVFESFELNCLGALAANN